MRPTSRSRPMASVGSLLRAGAASWNAPCCSPGQETTMSKFRRTLGATTLVHDKVVNLAGQDIGRIEELMIDVTTGRVAYAVLSFGGFLGIGNKLFALPWSSLTVDEMKKRFVVNVTRESLEKMPGFDKERWP